MHKCRVQIRAFTNNMEKWSRKTSKDSGLCHSFVPHKDGRHLPFCRRNERDTEKPGNLTQQEKRRGFPSLGLYCFCKPTDSHLYLFVYLFPSRQRSPEDMHNLSMRQVLSEAWTRNVIAYHPRGNAVKRKEIFNILERRGKSQMLLS